MIWLASGTISKSELMNAEKEDYLENKNALKFGLNVICVIDRISRYNEMAWKFLEEWLDLKVLTELCNMKALVTKVWSTKKRMGYEFILRKYSKELILNYDSITKEIDIHCKKIAKRTR